MATLEDITTDMALPHNIFADMGLPDPEVRQAKAMLSILIEQRIDELGLTQAQAAERMGLRQPEVSKIVRGVNSGFSFERLMAALTSLGNGVEIVVRAASPQGTHGFLRVIKSRETDVVVGPVGVAARWGLVPVVRKPRAKKPHAKRHGAAIDQLMDYCKD